MNRYICVTRFSTNQPGYLDFAYRIQSLAKDNQVELISNHALDVPEMQIPGVKHVIITGDESLIGMHRYMWRAARYIRISRPDCVILLHAMLAPMVNMVKSVPRVLYWNEHPIRILYGSPANILRRMYRHLKYRFIINAAKGADCVMPIGEAHYEDLVKQGFIPEKIKLIYMGVDERFLGVALGREYQDGSALELVYTGSVTKERGRDVMLEGVASACKKGVPVRLTLVGATAAEMEYCKDYARTLGIDRNIVVHGRVPGDEIPGFIAKADVGICIWEDQPWWRFNPPTKLFEYLVAGLPVLASNIRTHTQYIQDWQNGVIFDYDSRSFADAIQKLWQRRAELKFMKRRAFEGSEPYRWMNIEPVFLQTIKEVMEKRGSNK